MSDHEDEHSDFEEQLAHIFNSAEEPAEEFPPGAVDPDPPESPAPDEDADDFWEAQQFPKAEDEEDEGGEGEGDEEDDDEAVEEQWECSLCGDTFDSLADLTTHLTSYHEDDEDEDGEPAPPPMPSADLMPLCPVPGCGMHVEADLLKGHVLGKHGSPWLAKYEGAVAALQAAAGVVPPEPDYPDDTDVTPEEREEREMAPTKGVAHPRFMLLQDAGDCATALAVALDDGPAKSGVHRGLVRDIHASQAGGQSSGFRTGLRRTVLALVDPHTLSYRETGEVIAPLALVPGEGAAKGAPTGAATSAAPPAPQRALTRCGRAYRSRNGWNFDWPHRAAETGADLPEALGAAPAERLAAVERAIRERLTREMADTPYAFEIVGLQRRWLRYFSDGNTTSQSVFIGVAPLPMGKSPFTPAGAVKPDHVPKWSSALRDADVPRPAGTSGKPLLYDGPAWVIRFTLDEQQAAFHGCHVYLDDRGDFLCSDWCQRPSDTNKGNGIDLQLRHYTFVSWVMGPLTARAIGAGVFKPRRPVERADVGRIAGRATCHSAGLAAALGDAYGAPAAAAGGYRALLAQALDEVRAERAAAPDHPLPPDALRAAVERVELRALDVLTHRRRAGGAPSDRYALAGLPLLVGYEQVGLSGSTALAAYGAAPTPGADAVPPLPQAAKVWGPDYRRVPARVQDRAGCAARYTASGADPNSAAMIAEHACVAAECLPGKTAPAFAVAHGHLGINHFAAGAADSVRFDRPTILAECAALDADGAARSAAHARVSAAAGAVPAGPITPDVLAAAEAAAVVLAEQQAEREAAEAAAFEARLLAEARDDAERFADRSDRRVRRAVEKQVVAGVATAYDGPVHVAFTPQGVVTRRIAEFGPGPQALAVVSVVSAAFAAYIVAPVTALAEDELDPAGAPGRWRYTKYNPLNAGAATALETKPAAMSATFANALPRWAAGEGQCEAAVATVGGDARALGVAALEAHAARLATEVAAAGAALAAGAAKKAPAAGAALPPNFVVSGTLTTEPPPEQLTF